MEKQIREDGVPEFKVLVIVKVVLIAIIVAVLLAAKVW